MIIDCHGHYTTEPKQFVDWRQAQLKMVERDDYSPSSDQLVISDDEIRVSIEQNQRRLQLERSTDVTILSPRASGMGHHLGSAETSVEWTQVSNDMIARVVGLFPKNFVGVCALPQFPGVEPKESIQELVRAVMDLGFVGCNLNPDPSGGNWTGRPLTDKMWYPLYEKMCELDVPAMIHVSGSCNPNFHATGAHYIAADTTAFMQLIIGDLFKDFPTLKFVIPHGGGAVPYHWGRYRGLAQDMGKPLLEDHLLNNVFFDTCVYHQAGIDCMSRVVPAKNILFASEMVGAVKGIDPETGNYFDDTKRYIDATPYLTDDEKELIFEGNVRRIYPRIKL
ncbi:MAG: amidohydrolase family protein [Rhodospirillales bacterium]|jgi:4-oxalmesaconate hydratase